MKHPLYRPRPRANPYPRSRPRRATRRLRRDLAGVLIAGLAGGLAWTMLPGPPAAEPPGAADPAWAGIGTGTGAAAPVRASFGLCHSGGGGDCVVDGDTFWMDGEKIRVADIDTPETHPARCAQEAALGEAATQRLHALLNGGAITLQAIDRDTDRYGRKLRIVAIDGRGVGDTLVAEGLARPYRGGPRQGWCD